MYPNLIHNSMLFLKVTAEHQARLLSSMVERTGQIEVARSSRGAHTAMKVLPRASKAAFTENERSRLRQASQLSTSDNSGTLALAPSEQGQPERSKLHAPGFQSGAPQDRFTA